MTYHSYRVKDDDFVTAWQRAESINDVSAKVGMPTNNCKARANILRQAGVELPHLPRRNKDDPQDDA